MATMEQKLETCSSLRSNVARALHLIGDEDIEALWEQTLEFDRITKEEAILLINIELGEENDDR